MEDIDLLTSCPDCGSRSKRKLSLSIYIRQIFNEFSGNDERAGVCCGGRGGCSCSPEPL